jgi:hypothetical protein
MIRDYYLMVFSCIQIVIVRYKMPRLKTIGYSMTTRNAVGEPVTPGNSSN